MDIATKVEELNEKYKKNNSNGLNINNSINYTLVYGNIPILLSAPHAVKQLVSCLEITIENINKRCLTIKEQLER